MIYVILAVLNILIIFALNYWACRRCDTRHGFAELLLQMMPQELTGSARRIRSANRRLMGELELSAYIHRLKIKNMEKYLFLWFFFSIFILLAGLQNYGDQQVLNEIERPEYGAKKEKMQLEVRINSRSVAISEHAELGISPRQLSDKQKQELLTAYAAELPEIIKAKNKNLNEVISALNLIEKDSRTGIELAWQSNNPEVIREDGLVNTLAIEKTTVVSIGAELSLGKAKKQASFAVSVFKNSEPDYMRGLMRVRFKELIDQLNASTGTGPLYLPSQNGQGLTFNWYRKSQNHIPQLWLLFIIVIAIIYTQRYTDIEKQSKKRRESIVREFPYFISKFVLLLNAGLVVSTALKKISEDYERYTNDQDKKPLYEDLVKMEERIHSSNASLTLELRRYAECSGLKELMRFAAIVSDNLDKGSMLAEKLEAEGSLLWHNRKKKAEELGKLAETKLVLPLMVLLLVLIMITIAPALIAM